MSCSNIENSTNFFCRVYKRPESVFNAPCDSKMLGIFYFNCTHRPTNEILALNKNIRKAVKYETNNGTVFHVLRHMS